MDPSLFKDTQLGTGDGGLCVFGLGIKNDIKTLVTMELRNWFYVSETDVGNSWR